MSQGYFVTGTDTSVGKTLVSAALVHGFAQRGYRSVGMKPVASGCNWEDGVLVSEDAAMLAEASNVELAMNQINPYAFELPIAPHIAAKQVGERISLNKIKSGYQDLSSVADKIIVEGVGGFRVPLNEEEDTADLAVALGLPVIVVVGMKLGCINHALLTIEAIRARNLDVVGWVANQIDPVMHFFEENCQELATKLVAPCVGVVLFDNEVGFKTLSNMLKIDKIL